MARHFLALDGAAVIATPLFELTQRAVADIVAADAMGVVEGAPGLGKTFSVDCAVTGNPTHALCWVQFTGRVTPNDVAAELLGAVTGIPHDDTLRRMREQLRRELAARRCLVVVDEAQQLTKDAIEFLRWLWDDPRSSFPLLLVGGHGCWQVLSSKPMLRSRIHRRVSFRPLTASELRIIIPRYHPIYRNITAERILEIDEQFAHGQFRAWAEFTHSASQLCRENRLATISDGVVDAVFALHAQAACLA